MADEITVQLDPDQFEGLVQTYRQLVGSGRGDVAERLVLEAAMATIMGKLQLESSMITSAVIRRAEG